MIIIDFEETISLKSGECKQPRMYTATSFFVMPVEHQDNIDNLDLSDFNRQEVTRVTYSIWASVKLYEGGVVDMLVKEYDTEEEAQAEYFDLAHAVLRGDRLYSFTREDKYESVGNSTEN